MENILKTGADIAGTANTVEAVAVAGETASEILMDACVPLTYITLVSQLYYAGKDLKTCLLPNEQEQARESEIDKIIKILESREEFKNCLKNNKNNTERNDSSRPIVCEKAAYTFAMFGGQNEVDRMTEVFKNYRR